MTSVSHLQPNGIVQHGESLRDLLALPRSTRRNLRFIHGHLLMGVGKALEIPHRYLCVLRRPGPRIFSFYQFILRTESHPHHALLTRRNMSFGDYLAFSLDHPDHRLEMDNGQVRRASGEFDATGLGQEARLLRSALHNLLDPGVVLGLVEHMDVLVETLVSEGYLPSHDMGRENASPASGLYDDAIAALDGDQARIFHEYTMYDSYLYNTCEALITS